MDEQSKDSLQQEIDNANDVISKLQNFATELGNNSGNNILTHLCDGLEKFLGFNSDSKGYDGTGIVYSDLDRLCDAVMAFLLSIITEVKENNNLSPYKQQLITAVNKLKQNLNKGKTGLQAVIEPVKQGIKGWLGEVDAKNKKITDPLKTLLNNNDDLNVKDITILYGTIRNLNESEYTDSVVLTLADWIDHVQKLSAHSASSSVALDYVDANLRNSVQTHVNLICHSVEGFRLCAYTDLAGLKELSHKVDEEFRTLDDMVKRSIDGPQGLIQNLKIGVSAIKAIIHKARSGDLYNSIEQSRQQLEKALQNHKGVMGIESKLRPIIERAFEIVKNAINNVHGSLSINIGVLSDLVHKTRNEFEIISKFIRGESTKYDESIQYNWSVLKTQLAWLAGEVNGNSHKGLIQIYEGLTHYAQGFGSGKLKEAIDTMVENIVNSEGITRGLIAYYVGDNVSNNPQLDKQEGKVRDAVNDYLAILTREAVEQCAEKAGLTSTANLDSIVKNFRKFAGNIGKDLRNRIDSTVKEAVSLTEDALGLKNRTSPPYSNHNLHYAIKMATIAVFSAATKTIEEAQKFFEASKITKLIEVIKDVHKIKGELKQHGEKLDDALATVSHRISDIYGTLVRNTGSLPQTAQALRADVLDKLDTLTKNEAEKGTINNEKAEVTRELTKLKTEIDNDIKRVITVMKSGRIQLYTLLNDLDSALTKFQQTYLQAIEDFHSAYKKQSTSAQTNIKKSALSQFAQSKAAALHKLKELVTEEKNKIDRIIAEDLNSGLKGMMGKMRASEGKLTEIAKLVTTPAPKDKTGALIFRDISEQFRTYYGVVHDHIKEQIKDPANAATNVVGTPSPTVPPNDPATKLTKIKDDFDKLLTHLSDSSSTKKYNYDNQFTQLLTTLSSSLTLLHPSAFSNPRHPELLDAVKKGLQGFVTEMERVYVNKYEGAKYVDWNDKTSNDGENCAKILLSCIEDWDLHLSYLNDKCGSDWSEKQIKLDAQNETSNMCGLWFKCRGYRVSTTDKQDGELRSNDQSTGGKLKTCCDNTLTLDTNLAAILNKVDIKITGNKTTHLQLLRYLYDRLDKYRRVCHLRHIPGAKPPTTIYQMLHWLSGLYWNPMYHKLEKYMKTWFDGCLKGYKIEGTGFNVAVPYRRSWRMQRYLTYKEMYQVFTNSKFRANDMLIAVLGHGQPDGMYACDFYTNPHNLLYPSKDSACFDLLVEVCLRVNHQIRFLYKQCHNGPSCGGWRDCIYGKGVGGQRWQCNDLQCANQGGDQKHKQTCDQQCNQKAECGLKSPLQSFLEDGLPGFLPHPFSKTSCTITCELPNHFGKPCLTPMGFTDLGLKASHRQTGKHIKEVLERFCGTREESLNLFCAYLVLLLRRPPQTLCDMFTFYYNLLDHWCDDGPQKDHRQDAFKNAVAKANFGRPFDEFNPTSLFRTTVHNSVLDASSQSTHDRGDLFSLVACNKDTTPILPCGRYVQSIGDDIRLLYFEKHAGMYLSWIVYQAETFYDLLERLYKEVCGNCNEAADPCFGSRCDKGCTVKYPLTAEALNKPVSQLQHQKDCKSIVHCSNTHQVLFKYGFTFGSPHDLSGADDAVAKKRTCKDFCAALKSVLNKEKKAEAALAKLIFVTIPNFLWEIRQPFSYLVLALWSASFLYLIYVMVGRLDLLHIKSHLRSPASHRIAAQSLLAAARVGRLSKIAYLQP